MPSRTRKDATSSPGQQLQHNLCPAQAETMQPHSERALASCLLFDFHFMQSSLQFCHNRLSSEIVSLGTHVTLQQRQVNLEKEQH